MAHPITTLSPARQQARQQAQDVLCHLPGWPATLEQTLRQPLPASIVRLVAIYLAPRPTTQPFDRKAAASGALLER